MSGSSKNVEEKFDFTSAFPQLYAPKNREFALITVPSLTFLAIDGTGDPDGTEFPEWMIGGDTDSALGDAVVTTQSKGNTRATDVTERTLVEGESFQALHIGPYAAEASLLAQLHDIVMPDAHVTFNGPHHEIYLSDPRRSAPDKLRTILRQPVVPI